MRRRLAAKNASPPCRAGSIRTNGPSAKASAQPGSGSGEKSGCAARKGATTPFVLLRLDRARRVDEAPARPNEGGERRHELGLPSSLSLDVSGREPPAHVRVAGERAEAGARRVEEDRVERRAERRPARVRGQYPDLARTPARAQPLERPHAPQGDLGRDDPRPARAEVGEEQALAAGRRAGVEHAPVGRGEPADELRSLVLNVDDALRRERGQPAVEERERAGDSGRL